MEVVNNWRLERFRYGLRVNLNAQRNVLGNIPQGIKEYVEAQKNDDGYSLMAVGLIRLSEEVSS